MIISPRLVMANKGTTIFQEGDLYIKWLKKRERESTHNDHIPKK